MRNNPINKRQACMYIRASKKRATSRIYSFLSKKYRAKQIVRLAMKSDIFRGQCIKALLRAGEVLGVDL